MCAYKTVQFSKKYLALNMSHTVIRNVTLFDGKASHTDATVIFDGTTGLITSVSTGTAPSDYPSGATVIDGRGQTLIPGLIDGHIHCYGPHLPPGADITTVLTGPLKCGVTTVCDMHSDSESVWGHQKRVRDELEKARNDGKSGRVTMASLKSSHYGATIDGGWPKQIVMGPHPTEEVPLTADYHQTILIRS